MEEGPSKGGDEKMCNNEIGKVVFVGECRIKVMCLCVVLIKEFQEGKAEIYHTLPGI
jgi:hypothetical protein